jgi:hypothetical protein
MFLKLSLFIIKSLEYSDNENNNCNDTIFNFIIISFSLIFKFFSLFFSLFFISLLFKYSFFFIKKLNNLPF